MSNPKFTVAICGGGIAGLMTAIALSRLSSEKKDIRIDIYEAANQFTEIGAGVVMWKRPYKVMKMLGLEEPIRKLVDVPADEEEYLAAFQFRKSDQKKGVTFYEMKAPLGHLTFHRAQLLDFLVEALDVKITTTHFSKRLVSYTLPPNRSSAYPVILEFKDGTRANCDVLIGCDGIHSTVRQILLNHAAKDAEESKTDEGMQMAEKLRGLVDPVWSGSVAYRGVIPREELAKFNPNHRTMHTAQNYLGKDKHLIVFPISKGRLINVVAFCSWPDKDGTIFEGKMVEERSQSELINQYEGFEEEVQHLLQCIPKPSRWAINNLKALPISVHDRVALAGDAAHAMTPHIGSGAGQAIEDAYVLAALLAHPLVSRETLHEALKAYEAVRLPHANEVQRLSRLNGRIYEFDEPRFKGMQLSEDALNNGSMTEDDEKKLKELGYAAVQNWRWAWTTDIEDDKKRAFKILEERIVA